MLVLLIIITAHGFQGNLLGVRAVLENFNYVATGSLMSGYFIGYFFGAHYAPNIVSRVGHIRVFAAFASVASLSSLLHVVFVEFLCLDYKIFSWLQCYYDFNNC